MVAKTLFGFEELLQKELTQLGAQNVKVGTRVVTFYGDKGFKIFFHSLLNSKFKNSKFQKIGISSAKIH